MRLYSFILLTFTGLVPIQAQQAPVSIRSTTNGHVVVLSKPLQKAIMSFDSLFVPLCEMDFESAVRSKVRNRTDEFLSFCTGDFDGNNQIDAAILGKSGGGMRLLVALQTKKNKFHIISIKEFPFFASGEEDAYIQKVLGRSLLGLSDRKTFNVPHDAIQLIYYKRGSVLFYWKKNAFDQLQLTQ